MTSASFCFGDLYNSLDQLREKLLPATFVFYLLQFYFNHMDVIVPINQTNANSMTVRM